MARDFPSYLALADGSLNVGYPMSIGVWLQADGLATSPERHIVSYYNDGNNNGWNLSNSPGGALIQWGTYGMVAGAESTALTQIVVGQWNYHGVSITSTRIKFVRISPDGTVAWEDRTKSGTGWSTGLRARIGGIYVSGNARFFDGRMAEMGIWARDLTLEEHCLAAFRGPASVAPLWLYLPMWGLSDPEPDLSGNRWNAGVAAAAANNQHAPVGRPFAAIA